MREAISPRDRLSTTLRYLATGNIFQDLTYAHVLLQIHFHKLCMKLYGL